MTITATPTDALRGDICPTWCSRYHRNELSRGPDTHPHDSGLGHNSPDVDSWVSNDAAPIVVRVTGFRHDHNPKEDWPDTIRIEGDLNPGCADGAELELADARRLGNALLLACDLMEGRA